MQDLKTQIPVKFEKLEEHKVEDTRFTKVKIHLMHTGQNHNGSYFTKEVVEGAIPTLANTPILAYVEPNSIGEKDASDHRMSMEQDENDNWHYKNLGRPYGVIPSDNNAKFEKRICEDGYEREFLTVEGLLWNKWDEITNILDRDVVKYQSMELHENYSGYFEEDTGLFHFTDFKFYGACVLGLDYEPAMSDSTIELDFSSKGLDELDKHVQEKMEQFKAYSLKKKELSKGGEVLKEKLELLKEFSISKEDIEELEKNLEDMTLEELKSAIEELIKKSEDLNEEDIDEAEEVEAQMEEEEKEDDEELEEELEEELGDDSDEEKEELVSFDELQSDFDKLKSEFESLKEETESLRAFKTETIAKEREELETELFSQYKVLSDLVEFEELKQKSGQFEKIEDLEKELALLFVKNKANIDTMEDKKEDASIKFNLDDEKDKTNNRYGDLFEKYSK